jgi:23S rRNA (cytosine1962-C5)-methyltransferase
MSELILKQGRERSVLRRHPWIFSGAVMRVVGDPVPGETVELRAENGSWLARAAFSPSSQIRARIWTLDPQETVDAAFFARRIQRALARRAPLALETQSSAYRLVSSDADGLPGLVADRYGDWIVCQFSAAGVEAWKQTIADALAALPGVRGVYERSDADVRSKEGLPPVTGILRGEEPPPLVAIQENGLRFEVDLRQGHKTGFYLDQRDSRALVRSHARDKEVLNCFAYTGGFGIAALAGGARHVTNAEDVGGLISAIDNHVTLNGFDPARCDNLKADVFQLLRQYDREERRFDLIVLDPPKFVDSQASLMRAARGYKDINRLALKLLRPGGLLFTFSCSGLMNPELFQKIAADAALEAGCNAQLRRMLLQAPDHPIDLHIPESFYLKGFVFSVDI